MSLSLSSSLPLPHSHSLYVFVSLFYHLTSVYRNQLELNHFRPFCNTNPLEPASLASVYREFSLRLQKFHGALMLPCYPFNPLGPKCFPLSVYRMHRSLFSCFRFQGSPRTSFLLVSVDINPPEALLCFRPNSTAEPLLINYIYIYGEREKRERERDERERERERERLID